MYDGARIIDANLDSLQLLVILNKIIRVCVMGAIGHPMEVHCNVFVLR